MGYIFFYLKATSPTSPPLGDLGVKKATRLSLLPFGGSSPPSRVAASQKQSLCTLKAIFHRC